MGNYKQEELTINTGKAQIYALLYFIPFATLFGVPYYFLWKDTLTLDNYTGIVMGSGTYSLVILVGIILTGIIIHELIHGITWAIFARAGFKSMKFGVAWKYLTPYCHCKEPLLLKHYIIGGLMPAIILGIIPSIISIFAGNLALFLFGMLFILSAGGDFMIIDLLRKEPMNNLVQDHPSKIGCCIYRPQ